MQPFYEFSTVEFILETCKQKSLHLRDIYSSSYHYYIMSLYQKGPSGKQRSVFMLLFETLDV